MTGAYNPHPMQFGAQAQKIIEQFQQSLADAQGTALATENGTVAWVENHAMARVLAEMANAAQRLANQWDPLKTTDFLSRWEKILGIVPAPEASQAERRMILALKFSLIGEPPTLQVVYDFLTDLLGDFFVGLIATPSSQADGSVPGGVIIPGGVTLQDGDWRSSVAYIAIQTNKPAGIDDIIFYSAVAQIYQYLNYLLPGWATFDWFLDGPNGPGFYLDEDNNLDNQRFDA